MKNLTFQECKPLLDKFIASVRSFGILSVAVFGSIARNKGTATSDIDLLVLHKGKRKEIEDGVIDIILKLRESHEYKKLEEAGFHPQISPIFMSTERLKKHPWILLDVIDHGVILFDDGNVLENEFKAIKEKLKKLGSKKVVLPDSSWYWDLKPDMKPGEVIEI
jgi:predicted nucleotidyltransferase